MKYDLKRPRNDCFHTMNLLLCLAVFLGTPFANAQSPSSKPTPDAPIVSKALDDMKIVAPEFAKLTEEHLFGDIWKRPPLSARDKSLVTVTVLLSLNRIEQMESHFARALDNGVTKDELVGAITHVAYYAGWPTAASGLVHLKRFWTSAKQNPNPQNKANKDSEEFYEQQYRRKSNCHHGCKQRSW